MVWVYGTIAMYAQSQQGDSWDISLYGGKTIKHTPKLLFDVNEPSRGVEIGYHKRQNSTTKGLSALYYTLGNDTALGTAIAVFPTLQRHFEGNNFDWFLRMGAGFAYLNKYYDPKKNPTNNTTGSAINAIFQVRWGYWRPLGNQGWSFGGAVGLTHFSSGGTAEPNFGLNVFDANVGFLYRLSSPKKDSVLPPLPYSEMRVKTTWSTLIHANFAYKQSFKKDKSFYPVYALSLGMGYRINDRNCLSANLDGEYNLAVRAFDVEKNVFSNSRDYNIAASRLGISIADEVLVGNNSFYFQMGRLLGNFSLEITQPVYINVGLRHYMPALSNEHCATHIGFLLKTYALSAEYIGVSAGIRLF